MQERDSQEAQFAEDNATNSDEKRAHRKVDRVTTDKLMKNLRLRLRDIAHKHDLNDSGFIHQLQSNGIYLNGNFFAESHSSFPDIAELHKIAELFDVSIDWLLSEGHTDYASKGVKNRIHDALIQSPAPTFFVDKGTFDKALAELISNATNELWILLRAGGTLLECPEAREAIENLIITKNKPVTLVISESKRITVKRQDGIEKTLFHPVVLFITMGRGRRKRPNPNEVEDNIKSIISKLEAFQDDSKQKNLLNIIRIPYACSAYYFITDPINIQHNGKALALLANFRGTIQRSLMIEVNEKTHPAVFDFLKQDFIHHKDWKVEDPKDYFSEEIEV